MVKLHFSRNKCFWRICWETFYPTKCITGILKTANMSPCPMSRNTFQKHHLKTSMHLKPPQDGKMDVIASGTLSGDIQRLFARFWLLKWSHFKIAHISCICFHFNTIPKKRAITRQDLTHCQHKGRQVVFTGISTFLLGIISLWFWMVMSFQQ